jgi:hypothetical protein
MKEEHIVPYTEPWMKSAYAFVMDETGAYCGNNLS